MYRNGSQFIHADYRVSNCLNLLYCFVFSPKPTQAQECIPRELIYGFTWRCFAVNRLCVS